MRISLIGLRRMYRRWLPLMGWWGAAAVGVWAACLAFYWLMLYPMQARMDTVQRSAAVAQKNQVNDKGVKTRRDDTPEGQLAEFYDFFPGEKNLPQWLGKLVAIAEKNGLSLNDGEYKVTQGKTGKLMRYNIAFPVQGDYPQIRKFLLSIKTEVPVAALEDIQFEREDIVDSVVRAKIKLVLYLVQAS
jgi:hypothetical protein